MSEDRLWTWLKPYLPRGQYTRIETGDTGPGFPDVHYQIAPGISGTLELKDARNPRARKPFTSETGLRINQLRWIADNLEAGGTVYIIARVGKEIFFIPGTEAPRFNNAMLGDLTMLTELTLPMDTVGLSHVRIIKRLLEGTKP